MVHRFARLRAIASLIATLALLSGTPALAQHLDSEMEDEHNAMLNLVPTNQATRTAVANGNWSSGSTWSGGAVPGANDRVYIPNGRTITYDVNSSAAIRWIRIEGKLAFSRTVNTALSVDTIVINSNGEWEQGTPGNPIASNVNSTITFTDGGPIDTGVDTYFMSRGFLNHGKVRICGATTTPFRRINHGTAAGATNLTLQSTPTNWKANDQVVVTGMWLYWNGSEWLSSDEQKGISGISGTSLTLNSGLTRARVVEFGQFNLYPVVANLTRNITFQSANTTDANRKGHIMLMHNRDVDIRYAAFNSLGRTRKDIDVTNSAVDQFPPGTNPRARYALHFHRTGKDDRNVTPALVQGCVVRNPTSWGYVNHDSYVNFEDNVCFNAFGAAFMTENGAEIGAFRRNLAATVRGRGFIKDGTATHDLARNGNGFWFQGGNVTVEDNIATGAGVGFTYFERTGVDLGESQRLYTPALLDPDASGGNDYIVAPDTPMFYFKRNTTVGCFHGIFNVDNEINGLWPTENLVEDYTDLNSQGGNGIRIEYYRTLRLKNVKVLRDSTNPPDQWSGTWAISANHLVDHLYPWETRSTDWIDGVYIRGYLNGIDNDDGTLGGANPERIAQHEVLSGGLDFVGPGSAFANTSVYYGMPLVTYTNTADIPARPVFSPAPGRHNGPQTVTITSSSGTTIYYVIGTSGWVNPSLESLLKPGTWQTYTGPVTVNMGQKLIAIAYKNGKRSRIRNGVYLQASASQVAAPAFNPGPGTYSSTQNVAITTATSGATIRYTTDGSTPTTSTGTVYSSPVAVSSSLTLRAIAYKAGMTNSTVTSGSYTILPPAATPTFNPGGGTYSSAQNVAISSTTSSAVIYYTMDGSTPTTSSASLTNGGTVTVSNSLTLKAIAYATGFASSGVATANYTINLPQVVAPTFTPAPGTYSSAQNVTISTTTSGATIRYTTNGTNPTSTTGTVYGGPVTISATTTLKAIAYKSGMTDSTVTSGTYTINTGGGTFTLNPTDDRNTQNDNAAGTNPQIACSKWNIIYLKFDATSLSGPITSAKIRIYKAATTALTLEAYQVTNDSWTQATAPASLPAVGSLIASMGSGASAGYIEIDITSFVSGQLSGDKIISLALKTNLDTWNDFQTREGANKPQLVIVKP